MQTPAEKQLISAVAEQVKETAHSGHVPEVLNIGAGKSPQLEEAISRGGYDFLCDRIDIDFHEISHRNIRKCLKGSVEHMGQLVEPNAYDLAFANYVFEHVADIKKAAQEIHRVLRNGAPFIVSIPNPNAPEFIIAKHTPLFFHQLIKGEKERHEAYETHYAYRNMTEFVKSFEQAGFETVSIEFFPFVTGYTYRFPLLSFLGKSYDRMVSAMGCKSLMGQVLIVFRAK